MPKSIILGTSHTRVISDALNEHSPEWQDALSVFWVEFETPKTMETSLTPQQSLQTLREAQDLDAVFVTVLGSQHNILGLLQSEKPYDFFLTDQDSIIYDPDCAMIPRRQLYDFLYKGALHNGFMKDVKAAVSCPVYHISTPPPKGDNTYILENSVRYRGQSISAVGINDPKARLKLWELEGEAIEAALGQHDIGYLPPPEASLTTDGFLATPYYGPDATHANQAYGDLVCWQIQEKLGV